MLNKKKYLSFFISILLILSLTMIISEVNAVTPFGNNSIGANDYQDYLSEHTIATRYQAPETKTVDSIFIYGSDSTGDINNLGFYSDNSGTPDTLLGYGTFTFTTTPSWRYANLTVSVTSGTYYWLFIENKYNYDMNLKYDSGISGQCVRSANYGSTYPVPDTTFPSIADTQSYAISIYAHTITPLASSTYTPLYNANMLLHVDGNKIKMPNSTIVQLKGVNQPTLSDVSSGEWNPNLNAPAYSSVLINNSLDSMTSKGINFLRLFGNIYDWNLSVPDSYSNISQTQALQEICNASAFRGIWVEFSFYSTHSYYSATNDTAQPYLPYNPYTNDSITLEDFLTICNNVADSMKDYGNFIFEPFNEPFISFPSTDFNNYMNNFYEPFIVYARTHQYSLPIIVMGIYSSWININYPAGSELLDWINNTGLIDPNNNLMYDNHIYRTAISNNIVPPTTYAYSYTNISLALNEMGYFDLTHVIITGEIGNNIYSSNTTEENAFFNNTIGFLDSNGLSYAGFSYRYYGGLNYPLINRDFSNYNPTGNILFNWTKNGVGIDLTPTPTPTTTPHTISGFYLRSNTTSLFWNLTNPTPQTQYINLTNIGIEEGTLNFTITHMNPSNLTNYIIFSTNYANTTILAGNSIILAITLTPLVDDVSNTTLSFTLNFDNQLYIYNSNTDIHEFIMILITYFIIGAILIGVVLAITAYISKRS